MSPNSLSEMSAQRRHWTIIGNPSCRRVAKFQRALTATDKPRARLAPYSELMTKSPPWDNLVEKGTRVRVESAAEDWRTRRLLLKHGFEKASASGYPAAEPEWVDRVVTVNSPEFKPRQLYLGYQALLRELEAELTNLEVDVLQSPVDIACMFDKWTCQNLLDQSGIPIPPLLARPDSYDEVREACGPDGRFMLKMSHGSGGVGCVAIHWARGRVRAFVASQTMEMIAPELAERQIPVQKIEDELILARVVDALCQETAHLEAWLPKARFAGRPLDLRVVVIAGRARHAIARLGRSPFTNLNLGGQRQDLRHLDPINWDELDQIARQVGKCFSRTLHFGMDLLMTPRGELRVIDVNAFGDLLFDVYHEGQDPYAAEIDAADDWLKHRKSLQKTLKVATK